MGQTGAMRIDEIRVKAYTLFGDYVVKRREVCEPFFVSGVRHVETHPQWGNTIRTAEVLLEQGIGCQEFIDAVFFGADYVFCPSLREAFDEDRDRYLQRVRIQKVERKAKESVQAQIKFAVFYPRELNISLEQAVQLDLPFDPWFRLLHTKNPSDSLIRSAWIELSRSPAMVREIKRNRFPLLEITKHWSMDGN